MNAMYPQVIFPAFRMQSNMMMYTLGTNFWLGKRNKLESVRPPWHMLALGNHACLTCLHTETHPSHQEVPAHQGNGGEAIESHSTARGKATYGHDEVLRDAMGTG